MRSRDSALLPTLVALGLLVLLVAVQFCAMPEPDTDPFAVPTPTATATASPTATPTATPTPTPEPTAEPTPLVKHNPETDMAPPRWWVRKHRKDRR